MHEGSSFSNDVKLGLAQFEALLRGEDAQPMALLGPHPVDHGERAGVIVRAFLPAAREASIRLDFSPFSPMEQRGAPISDNQLSVPTQENSVLLSMDRLHPEGLYSIVVPTSSLSPGAYTIIWRDHQGVEYKEHDPYAFPLQLSEIDAYLFSEGTHQRLWDVLGGHVRQAEGVWGTHFAVWAPNARAVSLIGDHNGWDTRRHPMQSRGSSGIWELFMPGVQEGTLYKYAVRTSWGEVLQKADPFAFATELRPRTASVVDDLTTYSWNDAAWIEDRPRRQNLDQPIAVYEVHLGSWRRVPEDGNRLLTYRELADQLIPYVVEMGYTHLELLPITEHPDDASWGYQATGYFAPTRRFGAPKDFMYFVDRCHQAGIGVLLDWVPAHFIKDPHGLGLFDGTHLYEHADPRQGEHIPWGTYIFNYGRHEVRNFLVASALFWSGIYHVDGFRVDAVAAMLYLDYAREPGGWLPNPYGGRENLDAIYFLQSFNTILHALHPGVLTAAEESTAYPKVTAPPQEGGLGFDLKWNMGWMHDTLYFIEREPIHRRYHQSTLTFSFHYAFSERYILPLSHDEVVHLKKSLLDKMPGDGWQKLANMRLLYGYMYAHPGKKLLFMGGEFGQWNEWAWDRSLDWHLVQFDDHRRMQVFTQALNGMYTREGSLHAFDSSSQGFGWIDGSDAWHNVVAFLRYGHDQSDHLAIVANFSPVVRHDYRVGVPHHGAYREVFNSDAPAYGGSGVGNHGLIHTDPAPSSGHSHSIAITLPPLAIVYLRPHTD